MACDCIKTSTVKLAENIEGRLDFDNMESHFVQTAYSFSDSATRMFFEFKTEGTRTSKKGNVRNVKNVTNIFFDYCPFCGERFKEVETYSITTNKDAEEVK